MSMAVVAKRDRIGHESAPATVCAAPGHGYHRTDGDCMVQSSTPRFPTIRVNLLRAHGSPMNYLYIRACCRCVACRASMKAYDAAVYLAHRERRNAVSAAYYIANHDEEVGRRRRYMASYRPQHRDEAAATTRQWRKDHPDEQAALRRVGKHVRRARLCNAPGKHSAADVAAQYARQKGRCFWGRKVNPDCAVSLKGGYHIDHVVPLAGERTSSNGRENIVLACPHCNIIKGAKDPMDFAGVML